MSHDHAHGADDGQVHAHVLPKKVLLSVWLFLCVMTALTVWSSQFHLNFLDMWIAMGIATIKAGAVLLFFMHLLYDKPFHTFMVIATMVFVFLFFGLSLIDTAAQQDAVEAYRALNPKG